MRVPAAVLWDMDGLLVDSEPLWTIAETELAADLGGVFDAELKAQIVGTRLDVAVPRMLAWYGRDPSETQVALTSARLLARMAELFSGPLPLRPGALELLGTLSAADIPVALVSSSYRILVDAVLSHGVGPFALSIAGDELAVGKPDPLPYLEAARRLAVDPVRCVVLEDSPAGVASGLSAGCAVLAVPSVAGVTFTPSARLLVRPSLQGVGLEALAALVNADAH